MTVRLLALAAAYLLAIQPTTASPIRVAHPQFDPADASVTYEFMNDSPDTTAYEVSITRYFADGTEIVSSQGQDFFSTTGLGSVRVAAYSIYRGFLPRYSEATPGTHVHRLPMRVPPKAPLMDVEITVTAAILSDGSTFGRQEVLARLFKQRQGLLAEYAYWLPRLERVRSQTDPNEALKWIAQTLTRPRDGEAVAGPRESLQGAAEEWRRWTVEHPDDAPRILDGLMKTASQQYELLLEHSVWRRTP